MYLNTLILPLVTFNSCLRKSIKMLGSYRNGLLYVNYVSILTWSQRANDCSQQLKLQQLYQTTSNHSYTPYKEQESKWLSLCVQFSLE